MTIDDKQYTHSSTWNEMLSQPDVWQTIIAQARESSVIRNILKESPDRGEWLFVGCGTSFYLAEAAAISWTILTGEPARPVPGSEVILYPDLLTTGAGEKRAVVISRSGKTSEAIRAASVLRQKVRIRTLGITCTEDSQLARECDQTIVLSPADEKSTVMTRSFTSMLLCLQVAAALRAQRPAFIDSLAKTAKQFAGIVRPLAEKVEAFVRRQSFADYVFLGQGPFHGIAREAALKVMEMSCSYSQFFHALEFRHGPKAIVSPATCLTFFVSETARDAESEVLTEMKELGGVIVAVTNRANQEIRDASDLVIEIGADADEIALLAPFIVPCQLMGFFTGLRKGLNPDEPKNLTRVVILD